MEPKNSKLLHYILESLSSKPDLCDSYDNLCLDVIKQLFVDGSEDLPDAEQLIFSAVKAGEALGILTLTTEDASLPEKLLEVKSQLVSEQQRCSRKVTGKKLRVTHQARCRNRQKRTRKCTPHFKKKKVYKYSPRGRSIRKKITKRRVIRKKTRKRPRRYKNV